MTRTDRRGVATSAADAAEIEAYDAALDLFLDYERAAGGAVKQLLADHPGSVLGRVLRGYMLMMLESTALHDKAAELAASTLAEADHATDRERAHLSALAAWAGGDLAVAQARWDDVIAAEPLDLLALKLHHYTTFWTGRARALLDAVETVMPAWGESTPGFDHVLGMHAFGLNETGRYERAEAVARRAVERNPEDLWSIHAVAHSLEMQERHRDGAEFLSEPERAAGWESKNPFIGHIWWHAALFGWEAGDNDRVLDLYDRRLRPASTDFYLDIQNLSSLLTRLELVGVDVGDRWDELAEHAAGRAGDHVLAFTDVHCALTLARTGRVDELDRFIEALAAAPLGGDGQDAVANAGRATALTLARALRADAVGDPSTAVEMLRPVRNDLAPIGGSLAQRDVFDLLLIDMAQRAGMLDAARGLVRSRSMRRPGSVPTADRRRALLAAGR